MPAMTTPPTTAPLSIGDIAQRIHLIRGQRVVLDADLAAFYGETTKRFNQQVNRNLARFPPNFMFQLDEPEFANLRLQFATSSLKGGHGGRRYAPLAFTEHGAIMASMVLANLLTTPPPTPKRPIGFLPLEDKLQGDAKAAKSVKAGQHKKM